MKKIFTLFAAMAVTFASMATTFTFSSDADLTQTKDGITVKIEQAKGSSAPTYNTSKGEMRLYANNTITISGGDLSSISMSFNKQSSKPYATLTASTGNLASGGESTSNNDKKTDVWTGSGATVTFTLGSTGQRVINEIVVNGKPGEGGDNTGGNTGGGNTGGDTSTLDPDYTYDEPTVVTVPGKTVQGDAYNFISNNILVSCTKGAITDSYFSAHADYQMTFTATEPIKGLSINGMVKANFEATVSSGNVTYLTPSNDTDRNPVLVITDVDSKTVTISCKKQLRCYSVTVYFDANPEETVNGGTSGGVGEDKNLVFDAAEAIYESEWVEYFGEENYTVFLYNQAEDFPYIALDLYPETKDDIVGTYTWDDYSLGDYTYYVFGEGEDDLDWVMDGEVTISKNGTIYTIGGYFVGESGATYTFSYKGEVPFYLDSDYYYGDDDDDDDSAVDDIKAEAKDDPNAPSFNLQGQRVGKEYRGIVIRNGKKILVR